MGKEIKKETNLWGKERTYVYEDGEKVAEIKKETQGLFSQKEVEVTRDMSGEKIAVTSEETKGLIFPEKVQVTRDPQGRKLSETRHRNETFFRDSAEEIYEGNRKIGELKKGNTLKEIVLGSKRQILEESSGEDVDLAGRVSREESSEPPKPTNYDDWYDREEPDESPKSTRQQGYTEEFVKIKEGEFMKVVDKRVPRLPIDGEEYLPTQEYKRIKKKMRSLYSLGIAKLTVASGIFGVGVYGIVNEIVEYGWWGLVELLKESKLESLLVLGGLFLAANAGFNIDKADKLKKELKQLKKPNKP